MLLSTLHDLRPDIYELCVEERKRAYPDKNELSDTHIVCAFNWSRSQQGKDFWFKVSKGNFIEADALLSPLIIIHNINLDTLKVETLPINK